MKTRLSSPILKICPYRKEKDYGRLVIKIPGPAPELHALGMKVDYLAANPISHEEFTAEVAKLVPGAVVTSYWETGPWKVKVTDKCCTSRTRQPR